MQDRPLVVSSLLEGASRRFASHTIRSRDVRSVTEITYGDLVQRVRRVPAVLQLLGVPADARVATFAWNTQRHLELYLGVPSCGRVLHIINHRLFEEQLAYIIADAQDDVVFVDRSMLDKVWPVIAAASCVRKVIVMDDGAPDTLPDDPRIADYEALIAQVEPVTGELTVDDERRAAALCYTSGTTGNPKGVLYDHRSIVLHALMLLGADAFAIGYRDTVMPIVPMFHVNAWGLPYAAVISGAALSLPGPQMTPAQLARQLEDDRVSFAAAVTTVWRNMLPHLPQKPFPRLRTIISGGGSVPVELAASYRERIGVGLSNAWGMTETSPVVTMARPPDPAASVDEQVRAAVRPGPNLPLTQMRVRKDGVVQRDDGESAGELEVSGPTIAASYFNASAPGASFTDDGWLRTGDIATIAPDGTLAIVDRTKDVIKSGGEWISSVELENAIMAHAAVLEAAVIARPDERWSERPVACVVLRDGSALSADELRGFLAERVARWWVPEDVVFVLEIPKTATGKFSKLQLKASVLGQLRLR